MANESRSQRPASQCEREPIRNCRTTESGGQRPSFQHFRLSRGFRSPPLSAPSTSSISGPRFRRRLWISRRRNNYRSARENVRASELSAQRRARSGSLCGGRRISPGDRGGRQGAIRACSTDTANALYRQLSQQRAVGLVAQIDVNRSQVQMLTQRQRLVSVENDLAKQKINLARMVGLPPNDRYELADDVPFAPAPPITAEEALRQAFAQRSDLKATRSTGPRGRACLGRPRAPNVFLPLSLTADYGVIGTNPGNAHGTFAVVGSLKFPIWKEAALRATSNRPTRH